ncbi:MAG: hypothetical protein KF830_00210 [Planctomycetes bacterium]|nr:hypothetical protein [Planctomycetota bacterium]
MQFDEEGPDTLRAIRRCRPQCRSGERRAIADVQQAGATAQARGTAQVMQHGLPRRVYPDHQRRRGLAAASPRELEGQRGGAFVRVGTADRHRVQRVEVRTRTGQVVRQQGCLGQLGENQAAQVRGAARLPGDVRQRIHLRSVATQQATEPKVDLGIADALHRFERRDGAVDVVTEQTEIRLEHRNRVAQRIRGRARRGRHGVDVPIGGSAGALERAASRLEATEQQLRAPGQHEGAGGLKRIARRSVAEGAVHGHQRTLQVAGEERAFGPESQIGLPPGRRGPPPIECLVTPLQCRRRAAHLVPDLTPQRGRIGKVFEHHRQIRW